MSIIENNGRDYLNSLFSLEGKTAIITGAARGNGKAIAWALGRAGANLLLVDRLRTELEETANILNRCEGQVLFHICDVSNEDETDKLFSAMPYSKIDILVNNAGVSYMSDDKWDETCAVNLKAPFILSKKVAPFMKDGGSIINITSLGAELGFPNNPSYVASKGGLKQLTKALAYDLAEYDIRVNNVGPGYFKTNMTKKSQEDSVEYKKRLDRTLLKRWGVSSDLDGVVVWLASDSSSYVTGQDIYVDGGWLAKGL